MSFLYNAQFPGASSNFDGLTKPLGRYNKCEDHSGVALHCLFLQSILMFLPRRHLLFQRLLSLKKGVPKARSFLKT